MSIVCSSPCLRIYLGYHSCQMFVRLHVFVFISTTIHVRCLFVSMSSSLSRLPFMSGVCSSPCLRLYLGYHSCQVFVRLHVFVFISTTIHVRCLFVSMSSSLSRQPFMSGVCPSPCLRLYLGYHSCQVFVRLHVFVFISATIHVRCLFVSMSSYLPRLPFMSGVFRLHVFVFISTTSCCKYNTVISYSYLIVSKLCHIYLIVL